MNVFVSGKVGEEVRVRGLMSALKAHGHHVTFDWTAIEHLKPYEENRAKSSKAAILEMDGVRSADVLIVLAHEQGVGMFVELGAAIALEKPVLVVSRGPMKSMFLSHPLVRLFESTQGVLQEIEKLSMRSQSAMEG